jgi:hypothetical protein
VSERKRGPLTGPNPIDRGKPGSKLHVLTDAARLPLAVATSAANTHDSLALIPLVQAIPAIRARRGPRRRRPVKLHADKGYDYPHLRAWLLGSLAQAVRPHEGGGGSTGYVLRAQLDNTVGPKPVLGAL